MFIFNKTRILCPMFDIQIEIMEINFVLLI